MPRKTRRPAEFRVPTGTGHTVSPWPRYAVIALVSLLLGAAGMYAALRPSLHRASARAVSSNPVASPLLAPQSTTPPPDLTTGLTPSDALIKTADWYEDHSQWALAISSFEQAIAAGVNNADVRTDLGVAYYKAGQPQAALTQYQAAQLQNPAHENSLFNQGSVYIVLGQPAKAIEIWRDYIKRFPNGQHVSDARQLITQVQGSSGRSPSAP